LNIKLNEISFLVWEKKVSNLHNTYTTAYLEAYEGNHRMLSSANLPKFSFRDIKVINFFSQMLQKISPLYCTVPLLLFMGILLWDCCFICFFSIIYIYIYCIYKIIPHGKGVIFTWENDFWKVFWYDFVRAFYTYLGINVKQGPKPTVLTVLRSNFSVMLSKSYIVSSFVKELES
jgi:hypothetical protein